MVEVFRTNVQDKQQAEALVERIHKTCVYCNATFDLQDCDKVLRIQCSAGIIKNCTVVNILLEYGYFAEVLQD